eukprot:TRINITY_DN11309_c0_g1_i1.p1 TRINITY_DN11309_c0_g1~~TRINITY_DN11309_c0_g1_i1.p1  ORF type:complete len:221 (+),score=53.80 TRINITY_DN11309_c0_g1_i1:25-663(+)
MSRTPRVTAVGKQVKDILDLLSSDPHKPFTFQDIQNRISIDVAKNNNLVQALKSNMMIRFEEPNILYYKPAHVLKSKEDLYEKISSSYEGISEDILKGSYRGVEEDLKDLVSSGKLISIQDTDSKQHIIFPKDPRYHMAIIEEFKNLWSSIRIPDEVDFEAHMNKAGLGLMQVEKRKQPIQKKKRKERATKKVTNVHMIGMDDNNNNKAPRR